MDRLEDFIKVEIAAKGPMRVDRFMDLAVSHYYKTRDPFGKAGDFVTAPEVSQIFGEMIGVWVADSWMKMGAPGRFVLLECGPGRGTLMADLLRATRSVPGFHGAMDVHLMEISPVLRAAQGAALAGVDVAWHAGLGDVPDDVPMIVVANEFFDALPIRQAIYQSGEWRERVLDDALHWDSVSISMPPLRDGLKPCAGDVFEFSPAREGFMRDLAGRLEAQSGAALIIDYGHTQSGFGDTLQGVSNHNSADILNNIGEIDLTSHVDFEVLGGLCDHDGIVSQAAFLKAMGIETRAEILARQSPDILKDLHRLVNSREMGTLFKVMGVRYGFGETLAGF